MNLQAILASRKGVKKVEVVAKKEEKEEDIDLDYKATTSYEEPEESIYLALYTPFIKNPYKFDWFVFRDFSAYLLESSCYVLNTFPRMDETAILQLFLEKFSPSSFDEYAKLVHFVGHLCLCVPASYETRIREIIQKI